MTALEYILDGLDAELALERELGVRVVECDRSLLAAIGDRVTGTGERGTADNRQPTPSAPRGQLTQSAQVVGQGQTYISAQTPANSTPSPARPRFDSNPQTLKPSNPSPARPSFDSNPQTLKPSNPSPYPFLFIHDRPLSAAGAEIVRKVTEALGETAESAPVVFEPPFPKAKVSVILGGRALKKWFPGCNASPGQWIPVQNGEEALVSYSPEYILRLSMDGEDIKTVKRRMWTDLKAAHRKAKGITP